MCFVILYLTHHLLRTLQPYITPFLNFTDIFASLSAILTLIVGIFLLEDTAQESDLQVTIIFISILLFNISFLLYWVTRMSMLMFLKARTHIVSRVTRNVMNSLNKG